MVVRPLRNLTIGDSAASAAEQWLEALETQLRDPGCDRYRLCRETLYQIYYPGRGSYDEAVADSALSPAARSSLLALDPYNVTLEPEYYAETDAEAYAKVKPLLWLWQSFDRSPLGGGNVDLGVRLRRILAKPIFKRCGENFKCFQYVEFSFGYNMEVGDNVVVHRHVLLDDRGGIVLGNRVSIADYANVYSHTHDAVNQADITDFVTVLEDGVRITYHATILAGVRVGTNAMLGAHAVASRDLRAHWVHLGVPARPVRAKPNAPPDIREA